MKNFIAKMISGLFAAAILLSAAGMPVNAEEEVTAEEGASTEKTEIDAGPWVAGGAAVVVIGGVVALIAGKKDDDDDETV